MTGLHPATIKSAWHMLMWLFIVQISISLIGRSLSPLGPLIENELMLTKTQVGLLPSALFLGHVIMSIPSGLLVDRLGTRKLILIVSFAMSISFALLALMHHFWLLLCFVFLGGSAYSIVAPTTNRGVMNWFALKNRGTAMGIKQMGVTLGSALAALILLPLAAQFGWRGVIFISSLGLAIIGIVVFFRYFDPTPSKAEAVSAQAASTPVNSFKRLLKVINNKMLLYVSFSALCINGTQMALNTYIVFFAYEVINYSLFMSGLLLVISECSGAAGRVIWGTISDRLFDGRRLVVIQIVAVMTSLCCFICGMIRGELSIFLVFPLVVVFGFCTSGFNGVWMNAATESVPRQYSGMGSGFSISVGAIGVLLIAPIFGWLVDVTGSYTPAWWFMAALMIIPLILLKLGKEQERREVETNG